MGRAPPFAELPPLPARPPLTVVASPPAPPLLPDLKSRSVPPHAEATTKPTNARPTIWLASLTLTIFSTEHLRAQLTTRGPSVPWLSLKATPFCGASSAARNRRDYETCQSERARRNMLGETRCYPSLDTRAHPGNGASVRYFRPFVSRLRFTAASAGRERARREKRLAQPLRVGIRGQGALREWVSAGTQ